MSRQSFRSDLMMLFIALIWGSTFVAQRLGMDAVGPFFFSASRFILGAAVLLPLMFSRSKVEHASSPHLWRDGALLGLLLGFGINLQQVGLQYTSITNAGFITGLYVIFVPFVGVFLRHQIHPSTWLAVIFAAVGMYFLSVKGDFSIAKGDYLQLLGAVAWAAHVLCVSALAKKHDPIRLSIVQFFICGLICMLLSWIFEDFSSQRIIPAMPAILFSGIVSVGIAYTLQVVAQRNAVPSHAAIIFSMEAVFAALAAWLVLGEQLTTRAILGCSLMLAGMLIAQLLPMYFNRK